MTIFFTTAIIFSFFGYLFGKSKSSLSPVLTGYAENHGSYGSALNAGEREVRDVLKANFLGEGSYLLNNITLQTHEGTTQIDHILVSEYGVFIIETKNYSGWIFGSKHKKQWVQTLYKKKYYFQNPLHQNYHHVQVLKAYLDFLPDHAFKSIVVFTDKSTFKSSMPSNVVHLSGLIHHLSYFHQRVMSENRMFNVVGKLEVLRKEECAKTDIDHVKYLKTKHGIKKEPVF